MAYLLDCNSVETEFEFQWHVYVHFQANSPRKGKDPSDMGFIVNHCCVSERVGLALKKPVDWYVIQEKKRKCQSLTDTIF